MYSTIEVEVPLPLAEMAHVFLPFLLLHVYQSVDQWFPQGCTEVLGGAEGSEGLVQCLGHCLELVRVLAHLKVGSFSRVCEIMKTF